MKQAYLMLQAVPLSSDSNEHDAGLMLLTVQMSNGGFPGFHNLSQLTHQLTLQQSKALLSACTHRTSVSRQEWLLNPVYLCLVV